ncbi:peptidase M14 [Belliella sp. DSM 107340]|uniref:Peptidase M14 n=1 Tax=Belliella calami TaxID=2923436 RepID=A0ABS9UML7_9BACT|nr:M14 family zinc carboxypeptidase [Belliella calami]MCH7397856.1 peptidase M14 [Belliella calami]
MNTLKNTLKITMLIFVLACSSKVENTTNIDVSNLEVAYEQFRQKELNQRRFKYESITDLITKRAPLFQFEEIGKSVENRPIYQLTTGKGDTKVMLWSQMHGNESTATMALFDLMNFMEGKEDAFTAVREKILSKITLRIIPVVNPDGMNQWKRRNTLDIDLNRDAASLTSPESKILKNARDTFSPHFGFNLHDQQIYYNVSQTEKPASISVLAPAYNFNTEVNDVREKAMQVIVGINNLLQEVIPGQVGKYDDAFEPRAFGDNFQKWGTSTILIESGGMANDPEKQEIRKLNFMLLLHALTEIADEAYKNYELEDYFSIPDNDLKLMDLIIKNLSLSQSDYPHQVDMGIRRREYETSEGYYNNGSIDDLGDLCVFYGYETLDASGLNVVEGKIFETPFSKTEDITEEKTLELLQKGYLAVRVEDINDNELYNLPILILSKKDQIPFGIKTGGNPNFFLEENGSLKYAVVNGFLIDLLNKKDQVYRMKVL